MLKTVSINPRCCSRVSISVKRYFREGRTEKWAHTFTGIMPESGNKHIHSSHRTKWLKNICKHTNKAGLLAVNHFRLCEWEVRILWYGCGYDFFISIVYFSLISFVLHLCLMTTLPWRCSLQTAHSVWSWQMPTEVTLENLTEHLLQHSVLSSSWNTLSEDVFHFAFF